MRMFTGVCGGYNVAALQERRGDAWQIRTWRKATVEPEHGYWVKNGRFHAIEMLWHSQQRRITGENLDNSVTQGEREAVLHLIAGWETDGLDQSGPKHDKGQDAAQVKAREVLRCESCSLVQFRTANSLCRRCHKPLEVEEPERLVPQFAGEPEETVAEDNCLQVARTVRDLRKGRNLSQQQLAVRMQVARTYISKIENGKLMPALSSLARLAAALEIEVCNLLPEAPRREHEETSSILADPFLAELAPYIWQMGTLQRSMFLNQVRDLAVDRRRSP